jgi:hypothetical protein
VACRRCLLVRFFTGDDNDIADDDDDGDNVCVCVFMSCDFILIFFCFSLCFLLCNCVDLLSFSVVTVVYCFVFMDQSALRLLLCYVEKGRSERGSTFLWLLQRIVVISFSDAVF